MTETSTIAEIFRLTPPVPREQLIEIVKFFRERRKQYNLGNMTAGSVKPKALSAKAAEVLANVKVADLDL